jgi:UDP-glucose 4-epimerase
MNILITGGSGFLATHLKKSLGQKHTVFAPGKEDLDCLNSNAVDTFFENHNVDLVIHTALSGRENLFDHDLRWLHEGLDMWSNIYSNRHRYKTLIQYGSAYELDLSTDNQQITLVDVLTSFPLTPYGTVKNQIARMCDRTENFYTLRLFGHFHYTEAYQRFFKKLSKSTDFVIKENRLFDYFNLEDTLTVTEFVINERPEVRDINLVYNEKRTMQEQSELFCRVNDIYPNITVETNGKELTGDPSILDSFNLDLLGLEQGFKLYK